MTLIYAGLALFIAIYRLKETIDVEFHQSRHGIYREIPFKYRDEFGKVIRDDRLIVAIKNPKPHFGSARRKNSKEESSALSTAVLGTPLRAVEAATSSNSRACTSAVMPVPVSDTASSTKSPGRASMLPSQSAGPSARFADVSVSVPLSSASMNFAVRLPSASYR